VLARLEQCPSNDTGYVADVDERGGSGSAGTMMVLRSRRSVRCVVVRFCMKNAASH
jgi:hypothetical protein